MGAIEQVAHHLGGVQLDHGYLPTPRIRSESRVADGWTIMCAQGSVRCVDHSCAVCSTHAMTTTFVGGRATSRDVRRSSDWTRSAEAPLRARRM